ncbi:hypothetical protein F4821DRAFT_246673 [Hypoxylon rubiginosum]|uniref:Uncharacterized protein n=1 Tax=Hypoxylon rubiginosum TaxID=110542 RepID=A0ACC0CQM4_9PEZI|nr:hypothetical protein F4821DRAFT_246673 [Hypoxylon rubiginosum]
MSTKDQSFGSNNPFRRKLSSPSNEGSSPVPTPSLDGSLDSTPRPPFTTFRTNQSSDRRWEEPGEKAAAVQLKPKKVVKKVRVQSPPPSSPDEEEDAVPVTRFPPVDNLDFDNNDDDDDRSSDSDSQEYGHRAGPLNAASSGTHGRDGYEQIQTGPPANPFSTTLQDLEQGHDASALAANAAARGTLDVDSFKRLLLTGYANISGPSSASTATSGAGRNPGALLTPQPQLDGASNTDSSSVSRQSILDAMLQETPRTSHEVSEPEDPEERRDMLPSSPLSHAQSASTRKKPPPPSSRHGKLIKIELGADIESRAAKTSTPPISISTTSLPAIAPPRKSSAHSITPSQVQPPATDVNKPLPLTPFRPSVEEAVDSPFDREAIGKVPEPFADIHANPRPPTPPAAARNRSGSNGSTQQRKPAAPPPRRHGRSDSRAPSILNADDDTPPRSSLESNRSRADSLRANIGISVPAPPPPRRPNHARQGSSYASPNQGTFASALPTSPGISESELGSPALGLHRPGSSGQAGSIAGLATITTSKDGLPKLSPPPPPPARQASTRRPPSVRSMDLGNGPGTVRRVSREKDGGGVAPPPPPPPPRQRGSSRASVDNPAPIAEDARSASGELAIPAQGEVILADLDTLQKEVNALMGKYGNTGGS